MKSLKIIVTLVLALALTACGTAAATPEATPMPIVEADDTIIAEGKLEPVYFIEVSLNASGLVSEVNVAEGDTLATGDVIAAVQSQEAITLEDARVKASLELTEAYQEYQVAQSKLDDYDIPSQFKDMTPPQAVAAMLVKLDQARAEFEPYKHLDDKMVNYVEPKVDVSELSPEEQQEYYDSLEENKNSDRPVTGEPRVKKKALDNAWNLYRTAIRWLELETNFQNAQVRLANAQKDFDALQDTSYSGLQAVLANAELRAPHAGTITDIDLQVGEYAAAGTPVVTIADTSKWVVKTSDLTEIDVVNIKEGQAVTVKLDALAGLEFKGNVLSISQDFSENQGDVVYEVSILLTDIDPAMRWGMTAVVSFE